MPHLWSSTACATPALAALSGPSHRHDQRCGHPDAAVRGAVLPGLADRQGHRQARAVRGPAATPTRRTSRFAAAAAGAGPEDQLGPARAPHRLEREARISGRSSAARSTSSCSITSSAAKRATCRRSPARSSSRATRSCSSSPWTTTPRGHAEGAGARRHPARHRRPAPPAGPARGARHSSAARRSRCPPSSSTSFPKITSSRCSSRSTRSTRG